MRGTSRGGFAGVPNALNLELCLSVFFKSLSLSLRASWCWRVVLQCSKSQFSVFFKSLSLSLRGVGVLCCTAVRARAPLAEPFFPAALGVAAALYNLRAWVSCVVSPSGENPKPLSLSYSASPVRFATFLAAVHCLCVCCNSHTRLNSVSMRRYIMLLYSRIHQRDDASRLRRVERSRILLLFWRLGLRRRPLALSLLTAI